jgi:hypothetical protein
MHTPTTIGQIPGNISVFLIVNVRTETLVAVEAVMTAANESARHRSLKPSNGSTPNNGSLTKTELVLNQKPPCSNYRDCTVQGEIGGRKRGHSSTAVDITRSQDGCI